MGIELLVYSKYRYNNIALPIYVLIMDGSKCFMVVLVLLFLVIKHTGWNGYYQSYSKRKNIGFKGTFPIEIIGCFVLQMS